jgi:hypothetical protein
VNSDNLKYLLNEFVDRPLPECLPRQLILPSDSGKVIGLCGSRRCGKTFLFFETMRRLLTQGVDRRNIIYLNFEDDRLQPIQAGDLDWVLRGHQELFPNSSATRIYLFLDEVQCVPGWERWVRRLHDSENISIFVTGSSSRVLTRDLSTAMRGRSIAYEVFPLSFREFLTFKGIVRIPFNAKRESLVRHAFAEYLQWGGFPEVVTRTPELKPLILEEYASVMLFRDLLERYSIRNELLMRTLLRHCFRNTATLLGMGKLHRDLTSQGLKVGKNTLFEYMEMLTDSGLVFLLPKYAESLRKQIHNPKKLHVIDTGLVSAFKAGSERDMGRKFETAVFLECRRRSKKWYYDADEDEIDLVDEAGEQLIHSCWAMLDATTVEREQRAITRGSNRWPKASTVLLYHEIAPALRVKIPSAMEACQWFCA